MHMGFGILYNSFEIIDGHNVVRKESYASIFDWHHRRDVIGLHHKCNKYQYNWTRENIEILVTREKIYQPLILLI